MVGTALIFLFAWTAGVEVNSLKDRLAAQPKVIRQFIVRRAQCNYWGGEEPYDKARARFIHRRTGLLRCNALDRDEKLLRRRFSGRTESLRALDETCHMFGFAIDDLDKGEPIDKTVC